MDEAKRVVHTPQRPFKRILVFVRPSVFGDLNERGILELWNDSAYSAFRSSVLG